MAEVPALSWIQKASTLDRTIIRAVVELRKHPAYEELNLAVSPEQLAALKRAGKLALKDPLLVTREGIIIDGYARREYADRLGVPTLPCVEIIADEDETLCMILNKHRRSPGWNDYNRIRMASRLKDCYRKDARSNQQTGGHLKGLSKLTEASVRKRIADAAGVSEGNVTKVHQLVNSNPRVLEALARGEIRIHRAWLWRQLSGQEQLQELRLYRLKRSLQQPSKIRAFKHRAKSGLMVRRASLSTASLEQALNQLISMPPCDRESSDSVAIGLIKFPGKAALLTTELYEDLLHRRNAHQNEAPNPSETVS